MGATRVLRTRLLPPRLPPGCVARPRLAEAVRRGLEGRLVAVVAGAGYGKTSAWRGARRSPLTPRPTCGPCPTAGSRSAARPRTAISPGGVDGRGTHTGDLPGLPAQGEQVALDGVSVCAIEGGLIREERVYWDAATLLAGAGVLEG